MATIENKEKGPITLPTGHVVPRLGTLTTTNDVIRSPDNWPNLSGRVIAGQVKIGFDPEVDPDDPEKVVTPEAPTPPPPSAVLIRPDADPVPPFKDMKLQPKGKLPALNDEDNK